MSGFEADGFIILPPVYRYTQKFTYTRAEGVTAGPLIPVDPLSADRGYGWMRGFTYQDLCQRLAEGHHDE